MARVFRREDYEQVTSGTDVCSDQDLFSAVAETLDNSRSLFHLHLSTEQRHLVAFPRQLSC